MGCSPQSSLVINFFQLKKMIRQLFLVAFFFLASYLSVSAQHVLKGVVTDQHGQVLEGANIWISELRKGGASDAQGNFSLAGLPTGVFTLEVSFVGFSNYKQVVSVPQQGADLHISLEDFSYQVDALVVQGTRARRETPMTFQNLTRKELQVNNLGQDLPFLLQWTPSVVVTSDAGTGVGYTGIRIRGTDPTRINVTINGVPLNDAESQSVYWVNMPDFGSSISDVQIQRGVGASTNGAGAFGATINLNTARVNHDPYAAVSGTYGSFNTWKRNVEFGTGLLGQKFTLDGRLSRITSDGYIDRARADLNAWFVSAAMVGRKNLLRFNVFSGHEVTYQAWYGVPADLLNNWSTRTFNPAGGEKPGEPYENEEDNYRQTHYQLLYNQQLHPNWNLNMALHYTQGAGYYEQYKADEDFADYGVAPVFIDGHVQQTDLVRRLWLDNDFYGGVYSLRYARNGMDFVWGGGIHQYTGAHFGELVWMEYAGNSLPGQHYYDNDGQKSDFNSYARLTLPLATHWSTYGDIQLRQVNYQFVGYDNDGRNVSQTDRLTFFNPKAGITFTPNASESVYASFAVAQREPNRDDYVASTPESRPRPERLYDTEVGYRRTSKTTSWEATFYYMYYRDQLALNGQINEVGAYTRVNVDKSFRTGIELVGAWQPARKWKLQANATVSQNKIIALDDYLDEYVTDPGSGEVNWEGQHVVARTHTDLAFSPDLIAGADCTVQPFAGAGWLEKRELELSWQSRYVGRQFIDNASDPLNALAPYSFTNLRLRYAGNPSEKGRIELTLLLQNVFKARYASNAWSYRYRYDGATYVDQGFFPQAGRHFLLGLTVRW